ncbi:MAG: bacteriocin [Clostridia bacterium]|nr:bacteriocin [Clostridia bacterium]
MKTKEELKALKEEVENVNRKLHELTEEELAQVSGGDRVRPDDSVDGSPVFD